MAIHARTMAAVICLVVASPVACIAADLSPADAGARMGQALSAARFCPGAKTTSKMADLPKAYSDADQAVIKAEAGKIVAAWAEAMTCVESNPEIKMYTGCRKTKIMTCNATWREIGPDGTEWPGLVEFAAPPLQNDN
jgi:hypothetical protein